MTEAPTRRRRTTRPWWGLDPGGAAAGLTLAVLSLTPSLVPRPALLQGVIAAVAFGVAYLVGAMVWSVLRRIVPWRPGENARGRWWLAYALAWLVVIVALPALAVVWQSEVRSLVSMPPLEVADIQGFVVGFLPLTIVLLALGRIVRWGSGCLADRWGRAVGVLLPLAILAGVLLIAGAFVVGEVERSFAERNALPDADVAEPESAHRSAGAESAVAWNTLGRHGANFVGGGPSAAEIEEVIGRPALEPIRVYAGVASAPTVRERADLVLAELERTGAFERSVLVVATATGSGWLEPQTMDAIEYLHAGDTAIASLQYSSAPSWVSFVFAPDAPVDAARTLYESVRARWEQLPEDGRPKLIAYGLSLGAHGSQAIFDDLDDVRARSDGALFVGSPNGSPLWRSLQAARDEGSPAWQPVLDAGRQVRWMSRPADRSRLTGDWEAPRVLYLQHATDPVTWLGPELLWTSPDWLDDDQRSPQISSSMMWVPVVTGLQVTIDMMGGEHVPASYGHNYGDVVTTAWREVTGTAELDDEAVARIEATIAAMAPVQAYPSSVHE